MFCSTWAAAPAFLFFALALFRADFRGERGDRGDLLPFFLPLAVSFAFSNLMSKNTDPSFLFLNSASVLKYFLYPENFFFFGTMSNGNIALMVNMAKFSGLPWDVILGAEIAGQYKPHPQAYLNSAKALYLDPGQCMLAAAHNGDLMAARGVGFQCAFIPRPTEYGPAQDMDLQAENDYEIVAADFNDLADQLGCS